MDTLHVKWEDGSETKHKFQTEKQFREFVEIAYALGAYMRCKRDDGWSSPIIPQATREPAIPATSE